MEVKIKLVEGGRIPEYKTDGSSGADCYSRVNDKIRPGETKIIPLGFAVEIPEGYEMQIRPRSGLTSKGKLSIIGTIDSDYRGEVGAIIYNSSEDEFVVSSGDRISQAIISPVIKANFNVVEKLSETSRGSGGFGSTGKN